MLCYFSFLFSPHSRPSVPWLKHLLLPSLYVMSLAFSQCLMLPFLSHSFVLSHFTSFMVADLQYPSLLLNLRGCGGRESHVLCRTTEGREPSLRQRVSSPLPPLKSHVLESCKGVSFGGRAELRWRQSASQGVVIAQRGP